MTSRWLLEVAPARGLDIHWRRFSLTLLNGFSDVPAQYRARAEGAHDVLRVVEAARVAGEPQSSIGAFYTGAGQDDRWLRSRPCRIECVPSSCGLASAAPDSP